MISQGYLAACKELLFFATRLFQIGCTSNYPKHMPPPSISNVYIRTHTHTHIHTHTHTHTHTHIHTCQKHIAYQETFTNQEGLIVSITSINQRKFYLIWVQEWQSRRLDFHSIVWKCARLIFNSNKRFVGGRDSSLGVVVSFLVSVLRFHTKYI